jgi:hypothetical protein
MYLKISKCTHALWFFNLPKAIEIETCYSSISHPSPILSFFKFTLGYKGPTCRSYKFSGGFEKENIDGDGKKIRPLMGTRETMLFNSQTL